MSIEQYGYKQELKRVLSFWDLLVYGMIFMVPVAPFGTYGYIAGAAKGMVPLAYVIAMGAMLFTALSYARMSEAFPVAGSVYAYAQRGISAPVGFLAGWAVLLDYILIPSLFYVISGAALSELVPFIPIWGWVIIFVTINTVVNVLGIEFSAKMNKIILFGQFAVLAIFIVMGVIALYHGAGNGGLTGKPFYDPSNFRLSQVMLATAIAVQGYLGFDAISTLSEEVKGGNKVVGKATIFSLLFMGGLFIAQTWVSADLASGIKFNNLDTAFYQIAGVAGGTWLKNLTIVTVAISWAIASAITAQSATARILYSMGRDKKLPALFAKIHPKFKTPYVSAIFVGIVSIIVGLIFQSQIDLLTTIVNFGALTGFLLLHVSVISHYTIRNKSKHYFKDLISPIIGFAVIAYVIKGMDPTAFKLGITWLGIGFVYLLILSRLQKKGNITNSNINAS
jgi:amino acid transporter